MHAYIWHLQSAVFAQYMQATLCRWLKWCRGWCCGSCGEDQHCVALLFLPCLKNKETVLPVASGLQMLSLQSAWPTLLISRCSNKICKLPFKSLLNLAIYIACTAVIIGWCPCTDIRLYTFISLARPTMLSPAWKHWLSTQRLLLLFFFPEVTFNSDMAEW